MAIYYTIEILFSDGAEERLHKAHDLQADALMKFREKIFTAGFYIIDRENPFSGEVISPARINRVFVHVQKTKFGNLKPAPAAADPATV